MRPLVRRPSPANSGTRRLLAPAIGASPGTITWGDAAAGGVAAARASAIVAASKRQAPQNLVPLILEIVPHAITTAVYRSTIASVHAQILLTKRKARMNDDQGLINGWWVFAGVL